MSEAEGASEGRGGVAGAMPEVERSRTRVDTDRRAEPLARFGSGALSRADPMESPPLVVTGRNDG